MMTPLVLTDETGLVDHAWLADYAEALSVVSQQMFATDWWGLCYLARAASSPTDVQPGERVIAARKKEFAQPGELGDHTEDYHGEWFPEIVMDQSSWEVTLSHEGWESIVNPTCMGAFIGPDGIIRCAEVSDPVESFYFTYTCKSGRMVRVSDWVRPKWFTNLGTGPFSHCDKVPGFGEVMEGGYALSWNATKGDWDSTVNGALSAYRTGLDALGGGRAARRQARQRARPTSLLDSIERVIDKAMQP